VDKFRFGKFDLRLANHSDFSILMSWKNDPDFIRYSLTGRGVDKIEHSNWFDSRILRISENPIYIFEISGAKSGFIGFDLSNNFPRSWKISIYIARTSRGIGLGKTLLRLGIDKLRADLGGSHFLAEVHNDNLASIKLFKNCGFKVQKKKVNS
jgi:RimJ/RimL family protein N-acetyltransferase